RTGQVAEIDIAARVPARLLAGAAVGVEHVAHIEEQGGAQRALILDEGQREQQFDTALDQHVAPERQRITVRIPDGTRLAAVAGRTPRPQGAVLETTDRVETARIVMLVEGQPFAVTKAVTIPQLGVEAQRIA